MDLLEEFGFNMTGTKGRVLTVTTTSSAGMFIDSASARYRT